MRELHKASVVLVALTAVIWMTTGVGAATQGDPLANINCEEVDVDGHGEDVQRAAVDGELHRPPVAAQHLDGSGDDHLEGGAGNDNVVDDGAKDNNNIKGIATRQVDGQALNRYEHDHISNFNVIVVADHGTVVAECTSDTQDEAELATDIEKDDVKRGLSEFVQDGKTGDAEAGVANGKVRWISDDIGYVIVIDTGSGDDVINDGAKR